MEKIYEYLSERHSVTVCFEVYQINKDFLVVAAGGDYMHIGAISLNEQTVAAPGHKEDVITSMMAGEIRNYIVNAKLSEAPPNICVVGGIHVDHISGEQIEAVVSMCRTAAKRIAEHMLQFLAF